MALTLDMLRAELARMRAERQKYADAAQRALGAERIIESQIQFLEAEGQVDESADQPPGPQLVEQTK